MPVKKNRPKTINITPSNVNSKVDFLGITITQAAFDYLKTTKDTTNVPSDREQRNSFYSDVLQRFRLLCAGLHGINEITDEAIMEKFKIHF